MKQAFSPEQLEELKRLAELPDDQIDTVDIPEIPEEKLRFAWRPNAPLKQPVTVRLDADIVQWFKDHAPDGKYQSAINRVLRRHVTGQERRQG